MDPTTNFSSDMTWEQSDFSKQEYGQKLRELADKDEKATIMVDDHTLRVVGVVMRIWQTIKGWFGFENKVDPVKVNYELLKFLRYGESQRYLQDTQITSLLAKLQKTLAKEPQHQRIAAIIQRVFLERSQQQNIREITLDREISNYQRTNESELGEAFWPRLFHKYIAPIKVNEANVQYQQGRIFALHNQFEQAVRCLEKATLLNPGKVEWRLLLAKTYLRQGEILSGVNKPNEAMTSINKALQLLHEVAWAPGDETLAREIDDVQVKALKNLFILQVKSNATNQAIGTLKKASQILGNPVETIVDRELDHMLQTEITREQYGKLYLALAKDNAFRARSHELLAKAIDPLFVAVRQRADAQLNEELIQASLTLASHNLKNNDLDGAETRVNEAHYHFDFLKSYFPVAVGAPIVSQLVNTTQQLVDRLKEKRDFQSAVSLMHKLELLTEQSPQVKAQTYFTLAQLEEAAGDDYGALIEAEKAQHLYSKAEYDQFIDAAANRLAHYVPMRLPVRRVDELISTLERMVAGSPNKPLWSLILSKVYVAKVEMLCKAQKFSEANTLNDKALITLNQLAKVNAGEDVRNQTRDTLLHAYVYKFGILVKLGEPGQAVKIMKTACQSFTESYKSFLANYFADAVLTTVPTQEQQGRVFQLLANDPDYRPDFRENMSQAIERFNGSLNEKFDERVSEQLILSWLQLSTHFLDGGQMEQAEEALRRTQGQIDRLKEAAPRAPCLPPLVSKLIVNLKIFTDACVAKANEAKKRKQDAEETRNVQAAIRAVKSLKALTLDNRGELASHCFSLAKLERQRGNFYDAMNEAEAAVTLDPSKAEHRALATELANETETQSMLAENYFKEGDFEKALKCYLNCYKNEIEKAPHKRNEIINKLITLADYVRERNQLLAARAYESAAPLFDVVAVPPTKQLGIYHLLGMEAQKVGENTKAIAHFENALKLDPNHLDSLKRLIASYKANGEFDKAERCLQKYIQLRPADGSLVFALGQLYEDQRNFEKALAAYRRAFELQPDQADYRKKLIAAEIQAGDHFQSRAAGDPEAARQSVVNVVNFIEGDPQRVQEFHRALRGWFGQSAENREFPDIGKNVREPREIEAHALRAIEIINKAYDGGYYHMKPEAMPQELRNRIQAMQRQVEAMKTYSTQSAHAMVSAAIPHYLKAIELSPDTYGEQINKLIDAYIQIGDTPNAMGAYERFKQQFPQHPVKRVPAEEYIKIMDRHLAARKFREAVEFIDKALKSFPDDDMLKQAKLKAIYVSEKDGIPPGDASAFKFYNEMVSKGVQAPAECYFKLGHLYVKAINDNTDLGTNKPMKRDVQSDLTQAYTAKAVENLKKAADLNVENAEYQFDFARYVYFTGSLDVRFDPIPYLQRAVKLDPQNISYADGLALALGQKYPIDHPEVHAALGHYLQLKGDDPHPDSNWKPL